MNWKLFVGALIVVLSVSVVVVAQGGRKGESKSPEGKAIEKKEAGVEFWEYYEERYLASPKYLALMKKKGVETEVAPPTLSMRVKLPAGAAHPALYRAKVTSATDNKEKKIAPKEQDLEWYEFGTEEPMREEGFAVVSAYLDRPSREATEISLSGEYELLWLENMVTASSSGLLKKSGKTLVDEKGVKVKLLSASERGALVFEYTGHEFGLETIAISDQEGNERNITSYNEVVSNDKTTITMTVEGGLSDSDTYGISYYRDIKQQKFPFKLDGVKLP